MMQDILNNAGKLVMLGGAAIGFLLLVIVVVAGLFGRVLPPDTFDLLKMVITASLSAAGGAGAGQVGGLARERNDLRVAARLNELVANTKGG